LLRKYLTMIVLFGFLTACGGGGGSGSNQPGASPLTFQFKTAWGAYQQQSTAFPIRLSGTVTNTNDNLGSYAISGLGTVTQTSSIATPPGTTVQAIMVTRVYQFTALVRGVSIPQTITDVSYYDQSSYAYLGGTFTDNNTGNTINNVLLAGSILPPDTLKCCSGGSPFYETSTVQNGVPTYSIVLGVSADTANSVIVNLTDNTAGANRSYRLDNTNTLKPVSENINLPASVPMNGLTYIFNAAITFNY
jgi:hypothetical protein